MQELQQRILQDGDILPGGVVRVERFLNHRVDTALARHIGQAFADAFRNDQIDCILTVEASGIIFAMTTALAMGDLPVIIAKRVSAATLATMCIPLMCFPSPTRRPVPSTLASVVWKRDSACC